MRIQRFQSSFLISPPFVKASGPASKPEGRAHASEGGWGDGVLSPRRYLYLRRKVAVSNKKLWGMDSLPKGGDLRFSNFSNLLEF